MTDIFSSHRQYTGSGFDPDPEILGLFSNFEIHVSDEVGQLFFVGISWPTLTCTYVKVYT